MVSVCQLAHRGAEGSDIDKRCIVKPVEDVLSEHRDCPTIVLAANSQGRICRARWRETADRIIVRGGKAHAGMDIIGVAEEAQISLGNVAFVVDRKSVV